MAEAVLRHMAEAQGLGDRIVADSAGTGDWHAGEAADPRTMATLRSRGIACPGRARQLRTTDFEDFDLILAMDGQNLRDILAWRGARPEKVRLFGDRDLPDPYYGGPEGFDRMYDQIEAGCREILRTAAGE